MTDNADQAARMRDMWSAVALTSLNDAIRHASREPKKNKGRALKTLTLWANSRDGREVLSMAGIDPDKRVTDCMVAFAVKGVPLTTPRKRGAKL
jgi:hypothetical protein